MKGKARSRLVAAGEGFDLFGEFFDLLGLLDHGEAEDVLGLGLLDFVFEFASEVVELFYVVADFFLVLFEHQLGIEFGGRFWIGGFVLRVLAWGFAAAAFLAGHRNGPGLLRRGRSRESKLEGARKSCGGGKREESRGKFYEQVSFRNIHHGLLRVRRSIYGHADCGAAEIHAQPLLLRTVGVAKAEKGCRGVGVTRSIVRVQP